MLTTSLFRARRRSSWKTGWATGAAAAGAAGLAAGAFHYAALWPASQLFGRALIAGDDPAEVALTFDDGPSEQHTGRLLDLLDRHQVPATFFVIGRYVRQSPHMIRALRQAGHTVGCHTMTHPRLMYMSQRAIYPEIAEAAALIEDVLGERVRYFRPPFGGRNPAVFRILRELHLTPVLWNVNTRDWRAHSAAEIEQRLEQGILRNRQRGRGSNILMHDGSHLEMHADRSRTVAATAKLLAAAPDRGLRFVSLDGWNA